MQEAGRIAGGGKRTMATVYTAPVSRQPAEREDEIITTVSPEPPNHRKLLDYEDGDGLHAEIGCMVPGDPKPLRRMASVHRFSNCFSSCFSLGDNDAHGFTGRLPNRRAGLDLQPGAAGNRPRGDPAGDGPIGDNPEIGDRRCCPGHQHRSALPHAVPEPVDRIAYLRPSGGHGRHRPSDAVAGGKLEAGGRPYLGVSPADGEVP